MELCRRNLAAASQMDCREERPQMVIIRESPEKGNKSLKLNSSRENGKKGMDMRTEGMRRVVAERISQRPLSC